MLDAGGMKVSIHAPVWGATCPQGLVVRGLGFNPRTRVGCDMILQAIEQQGEQFQSTHPCGVRPTKRQNQ